MRLPSLIKTSIWADNLVCLLIPNAKVWATPVEHWSMQHPLCFRWIFKRNCLGTDSQQLLIRCTCRQGMNTILFQGYIAATKELNGKVLILENNLSFLSIRVTTKNIIRTKNRKNNLLCKLCNWKIHAMFTNFDVNCYLTYPNYITS